MRGALRVSVVGFALMLSAAVRAQDSAAPATDAAALPPASPAAAANTGAQAAHDIGDAPLSNDELASLGLNGQDTGLDTSLRLSGFMDVNYVQLLNPKQAPLSVTAHGDEGSFFVGHLNLYAAKNLTETFRMMAEVRFTYAPNGTPPPYPGLPVQLTDTLDYNTSGSEIRWGGILIERAFGEWSPLPFLSIRLGSFLTPYGIWNVDHGSPTIIAVMRPYTASGRYFPERQTGIEAFGRWGLTSDLSVRYHLTVSNGYGPISEYRDLDSNKAIGGRLAFEYLGLGTLQLGGSALYGRNSQGLPNIGVANDGMSLTVTKSPAGQSDITALGADVLWKFNGFHMQAEWVGQRRLYTKEGRSRAQAAGMIGVPTNGLDPDVFDWAGYVLVGYRLPFWGLMPFATLEHQRVNAYGILAATTYCQYGVNIRASDEIAIKVNGYSGLAASAGTKIQVIASQVAWAF